MVHSGVKYVPIDFIKAQVLNKKKHHFLSNDLFGNVNHIYKNGALSKTILTYKNLKITIYENNHRIELSGSLHTFYNNGKHNHNDFGYLAFLKALEWLKQDLDLEPSDLYLIQLEWGYNLKLPLNVGEFLDRCIQHRSVNKTVGIDCPKDGKYIQFKHSNYILKVYDKGTQFKLPEEVLRVEIKRTNWSEYRNLGITTFQDFIDYDKSIFLNELITQWERILFFDLEVCEENKFLKYSNQSFWTELRRTKSNKNFKYHFDKLKELNKNIGLNRRLDIVAEIIKKGNELQL